MGRFSFAALLGGLLVGVQLVHAEEPPPARFQAGFLELHPALNASAVYDDNIFKVSSKLPGVLLEPTDDIYLTVNPRFAARMPFDRSYLEAGYGWQAVKYLNVFDNKADTTIWDTFNTHTAYAEASLKLGRGLGLGLRDDFQRKNLFITSVDLTTVNPADRDSFEPIGLYHNELKPAVTYRFEDSNLELDSGYTMSSDRFVDNEFTYLNKDIHVPRGRVSYRFFPKTAGFVEGEGYLVRYLDSPDANSFQALDKRNATGWKGWLGAQGNITSRLTAIVAAGWGRLNYEVPPGLAATQSEDANTWLAKFELNEKFSERTKVTLGISRDFLDSYSTNFYTTTRGYVEAWRSLTPAFAVVLGGNYFQNHYSRPNARKDHGYLGAAKLEVRPLERDWLKINTGYNREQRWSTFDWYQYATNQVFAEVAIEL